MDQLVTEPVKQKPKKPRQTNDLYETPEWLTRAIIPELERRLGPNPYVYEPACGNLKMVNVLRERPWSVDGSDLYGPYGGIDFRTEEPKPIYDLIITNPPYKYAMDFIQRAMLWRKSKDSVVAMLLRVNFLGSRKRAAWLRENTPSIYVSPARPSFVHGRTDQTEYAWFLWQEPFIETATVGILETEHV